MIKKQVDTLIASNPRGFLPDDITRLIEKVYIWNVNFTENSKDSIEECFQVNALIAEVDDGNALPVTPVGSHSSFLCSLKMSAPVCKALLKKVLLYL
jgi:replication factor A1